LSFTEETIQRVWEKGTVVDRVDPNVYRKDVCGAWIRRDRYGNRNSSLGWEIDHIKPESEGGGDELSNLRPLQWANNTTREDGRRTCPVTASGNRNIRRKV
jgi:5-methylcytosine-specific restriction endonuclease McrA